MSRYVHKIEISLVVKPVTDNLWVIIMLLGKDRYYIFYGEERLKRSTNIVWDVNADRKGVMSADGLSFEQGQKK